LFLPKPIDQNTLARVDAEVLLKVETPVALSAVLDALETCHPVLRGAIRDQITLPPRGKDFQIIRK
jgi:hypothetical protein